MSRNKLWLRLVGDLPSADDLLRILGIGPTSYHRRGTPSPMGGLHEQDVWTLTLIERRDWEHVVPEAQAEAEALATLQRLTPGLLELDQSRWERQLYLSSIRDEEQGGFYIPAELVSAAAAAHLALDVSVLVMWYGDEEAIESEEEERGDHATSS